MEFWQRVHWFFTSKCNERCKFCFKPDFDCGTGKNSQRVSEVLCQNGVKEVIFTGGEPLLSKKLELNLGILKQAGIYTSLHTNATLLDEKRLDGLVGILDDIAIPIDSVRRNLQAYLRETDCLPKIRQALKMLRQTQLKIGIHTVATDENMNNIPAIYRFLLSGRFDYWKIYDFNPDIVSDRFSSPERFFEVERLRGATKEKENDGGVNSLFAKFLLMEERMLKCKDSRIKFVGVYDYDRDPYFFLDSNGEVYMATWFSQNRKPLGNILHQGFTPVRDRAIEEYKNGPLFDEEGFVNAINDKPLFARAAFEGNIFTEELEEVSLRYVKRFVHLGKLYLDRLKRQRYAPDDAELGFTYSL